MAATQSLWRGLLTVVRTVTLVAFSVAAAGHAHAGAPHVGHPTAVVGHLDAPGPDRSDGLADHAERSGDDTSTAQCSLNCCCQAVPGRWEGLAVPMSWRLERSLAGLREVAFASVSPESFPEPPRTLA